MIDQEGQVNTLLVDEMDKMNFDSKTVNDSNYYNDNQRAAHLQKLPKKGKARNNYYFPSGGEIVDSTTAIQYGLHDLFPAYARWGNPHSTGQYITLGQVEKWLGQAGIVDNWNITTTDTAISFRKISR